MAANTVLQGVAALAAALAWPLTAIAFALLFRKHIADLPLFLRQNVRKISLGGLSLEFADVPPVAGASVETALLAVREPLAAVNYASYKENIRAAMLVPSQVDAVVIDLTTRWLTSRLFFSAVLLERMRGLRCFVFVETGDSKGMKFLGSAAPSRVRWALARRSTGPPSQ